MAYISVNDTHNFAELIEQGKKSSLMIADEEQKK